MSDASEYLARVRLRPTFRTFADAVGARLLAGRSVEAFRMLVSIGAAPAVAHEIVEGWPLTEVDGRIPGLELGEEAACRLAHFVRNLEAHQWAHLLARAEAAAGRPLATSRPGTRGAG